MAYTSLLSKLFIRDRSEKIRAWQIESSQFLQTSMYLSIGQSPLKSCCCLQSDYIRQSWLHLSAANVCTREQERRFFTIFFLSSFCQLLSPRIQARTGWVRPDQESSDQPAWKAALSDVVSLVSTKWGDTCIFQCVECCLSMQVIV